MKRVKGKKKELDSYLASVEASQKNVLWPDVLRGNRSVDELLWKGARGAPLVQRVGVGILALAYLVVACVFVAIAAAQGSWIAGVFAGLLFGVGGWFIRNALMR